MKETLPIVDNKPRARSAAPKITFTFTNNKPNVIEVPKPIILPKNKPLAYEHKDCILESIINPGKSPMRGR
jgi:hypothetical protein